MQAILAQPARNPCSHFSVFRVNFAAVPIYAGYPSRLMSDDVLPETFAEKGVPSKLLQHRIHKATSIQSPWFSSLHGFIELISVSSNAIHTNHGLFIQNPDHEGLIGHSFPLAADAAM